MRKSLELMKLAREYLKYTLIICNVNSFVITSHYLAKWCLNSSTYDSRVAIDTKMLPQGWNTSFGNNSNFCAVVPELSHRLLTTPPLTMKQAHANWSETPYWINIWVTDESNWYKWWITNETNMYPNAIPINPLCIFRSMVVVFDWKYLQFADIFIEIQAKTYDMLLK